MRKWIIGLALLALLIYAGRTLVLSLEEGVRDSYRAQDDFVRMRAEQEAAKASRAMEAAETERMQQIQSAVAEADGGTR